MIKTHRSSFETGAEYSKEELLDQFLPDNRMIVGSDMDGTMFNNDIGILVFLEILSDPKFWKLKTQRFKALLLPSKYRKVFQEGAQSGVNELDQIKCQYVLKLWEDISDLYRIQRGILNSSKKEIDINNPVVNEFSRKMLEFDTLLIEMERLIISRFGGELLMRTRFFVDQNREVVDTLIDNVMSRKAEDKDASLHLSIHSENGHHYNQRIKENELAPVDFNRIVVINNNTAALIREVFDRGASVRVITTNNLENALGAINNSSYSYLNHRRTISASRLKINGEKFGSKMDGMPVFGPRKVDIAREIENAKNRIFKVALGDSFTNDGPMMRYALRNGGVAVVVSEDYEKARAKFNPIYEELGENGVGERMWYVDSSKLEDN